MDTKVYKQVGYFNDTDIVIRIKPGSYLHKMATDLAREWGCTPQEAIRLALAMAGITKGGKQ